MRVVRPRQLRRAVLGLTLGAMMPVPRLAAQTGGSGFPSQPISIIVPFAAGGIADLTTRILAEALARSLAIPVVVENKPGAGNIVASQLVARAKPDGHTLLLMSNSHAVSAGLFRQLPFDAQKDFAPIGLFGSFELGLFVNASAPHTTLRSWLIEARARPGQLNVGTIAIGSTQHLAAELLKRAAGIDVVVIPYKGSPAVLTALRSGEVDMAIEILGPTLPQVHAGTIRVLAVTGALPNASLPAVPTVTDGGVAGYEVESWNGLAAPAGTPTRVLERLNRSTRETLELASVRERLAKLGVRPRPGPAEEMQQLLGRETTRWSEVIRAARIEPQ